MSDVSQPPIVFVSYSHDSREHKQWVTKLATALREKHVEVILDQWDLEPGDDVPKFMERAVKAADRVLMICSDPYVRKANDGKGGAGYETMIVTGELVRDLGTRKFIPIIRQGSGEPSVPDCMSTRLYIDFNKDEEFDTSLEDLIKTLHKTAQLAKPPLGPNPFASLSTPTAEVEARRASAESQFEAAIADPKVAYSFASTLSVSGDTTTWRRLLRTLQRRAASDLVAWRQADATLPEYTDKDVAPLYAHAGRGVSFYMPLFACLVAGAESGKEEFCGQLSWIDEVETPAAWERSGYTYWTDFPELLLYVGQALVGGMLMDSKRGDDAYELATTKIPNYRNSNEVNVLFRTTRITGWPESMAHHCNLAWGFLNKAILEQEWIGEAFGSADHARSAVSSYYQLLSFLNFCHVSANGHFESDKLEWAITVPLNFCRWPEAVVTRGYRIFFGHRSLLQRLLAANGLKDPEKFKQHWQRWLEVCGKWLGNVFHWHFDFAVPQSTLPADLQTKGLSLKES